MNTDISIRKFDNIAVYQTAFIGDVVLSFFLLQAIKDMHPGCKLTFVTTRPGGEIASALRCLDHTVIYDKRSEKGPFGGIGRIAGILRDYGTDCFISAHRSARSALIAKKLSCFSIGYDIAGLSFLYKKRTRYNFYKHEKDRLLDLLSIFTEGRASLEAVPKLDLQAEYYEHMENLLLQQNCDITKKKVLLAPGSVWGAKRWPASYFAVLAEKLRDEGYLPVFIGNGDDRALSGDKSNGIGDLTGCTDLKELAALMSHSELLISNDSSPVHFASLTGLQTIAIFGPTSPAFGFTPLSGNSISVYKGLSCSPCNIHGGKDCPLGHHDCMKLIRPEEILSHAVKLVKL